MPAPQGYIFTEADKREFNRLRHKVDSISGPGVTNRPDTVSINPPKTPARAGAPKSTTLPQPQYQYMMIGAVSQNQLGAFFTPAVSMSMS